MKFTGVFIFMVIIQMESLYKKYLLCTGATTDTRSVGTGDMFFALKGDKFNANKFAADALNSGAAFAVVDEIEDTSWKHTFGERLILVDDVLKTLQQLAGHHRNHLKCPVLAITGSNGKTTTKELIAAVLSKRYKTYATKGNLNNHIGIPLTLLAIKSDVEMAVIEMGANHVGEIASYCEYVRPDYGLITNVGMAHTEGFGGFEGVVKGKTELYKYIAAHQGKVFLNLDNGILTEKVSDFGFRISDVANVISYGRSASASLRGKINSAGELLSVSVVEQDRETVIQTNLIGEYNFENVLSAVCVGKYFGVEMQQIKEAIENYVPANNRSQKIAYGSNTIILDAYNANPASMSEALKNFDKINAPNKIVILGEMMELGEYAKAEHEKIAATVETMQLAKKVFTGTGFSFLKQDPSVIYFEKTDELKVWFKNQQFENCYMLIKGSRKNELEKIIS